MNGPRLTDGCRRALRAWPMALMLAALSTLPSPAVDLRDRMFPADLGLGGFPFNISAGEYYQAVLSPAQNATLALLLVIWIFLSGGIIDRLARDSRSPSSRFFAACGACFAPLIRLTLLSMLVYAGVLTWIEPRLAALSGGLSETARLALFGALATLLFLIAIVFDYARVRLVIEDRRSALGALMASLRMLRAHAGRLFATQALFWLLLVLWITLRASAGAAPPVWLAFIFTAGELLLKLALIGSQVSLYQHHFATAGWVARRDPSWPDEPSANPAAI